MRLEHFDDSPSGHLVPTFQGAMAFVPDPLPPKKLNLEHIGATLERATLALGELSGVGRSLTNPNLLIRPFSRTEAVASSKIEGTVTTIHELLALEVGPDTTRARHDTIEVRNYSRALEYGLQRISTLPISKRLMLELHEILLKGVPEDRGARFEPGKFKTHQNWIGARTIQGARFVPPPPTEALRCLEQLEEYIHSVQSDVPLLIQTAMIHYQFEAIHPFPDGNGRVGRLLIPLILGERNAMSQPLLYLSPFFEKRYDDYIDLMYNVSAKGEWLPWIEFFLEAIHSAATAALEKSHKLQDLHKNYLERVQTARSSALLAKIIDQLFMAPATTIPHAMRNLEISYNSAKNNINKLVELGILSKIFDERPQWYFATEIILGANE